MPTGIYKRANNFRELQRQRALKYEFGKWMKGRTREKSPSWKGGVYITDGYRYILDVTCRRIAEHRIIMEKYLGRKLTKDEIIHHINENRLDNRIENLELLNRTTHIRLHFDKIKDACAEKRKLYPEKFVGNTGNFKIPKKEFDNIINLHKNKISVVKLAKQYNVCRNTIYKILGVL